MATLSKMQAHLLGKKTKTYAAYYNGKMSYALHGKDWSDYVAEMFPDLAGQQTSENVFKTVIDLYAENLVPMPDALKPFSNCLVPLLSRGEALVIVTKEGEAVWPEHYEMVSDGRFTIAAVFTRDLEKMNDYVTFIDSNGRTSLWAQEIPEDLAQASTDADKWHFVEDNQGYTLFRFALDDKGFGASLAALQDRVNHSIIDQTVIAEMYARPFWYLMNVEMRPNNPYLPKAEQGDVVEGMQEQKTSGASGRIFTTSSEGPFGQLEPPTIQDMIAYHDSIIDKTPQAFGIPAHYLKPGTGTPPTGVALKVLSKRFNTKIARMREDLAPVMEALADMLGVEKTLEVPGEKVTKMVDGVEVTEEGPVTYEYEFWNTSDDLLQDALDAHGMNLVTMGYPLKYIAEVVTPGVDLDDYIDETTMGYDPSAGAAIDPASLPPGMTPDQVKAYSQNPGGGVQGASQATGGAL